MKLKKLRHKGTVIDVGKMIKNRLKLINFTHYKAAYCKPFAAGYSG